MCRVRRRIERQIQIDIRRFLLAQVIKNRHPAAVERWLRAHKDRGTVSDLLDELGSALARRKSAKRRDRSIPNLLGIGIRPGCAVAGVGKGVYYVFAPPRGGGL